MSKLYFKVMNSDYLIGEEFIAGQDQFILTLYKESSRPNDYKITCVNCNAPGEWVDRVGQHCTECNLHVPKELLDLWSMLRL